MSEKFSPEERLALKNLMIQEDCMLSLAATPQGLKNYKQIEDLNIEPCWDWVVFQRVTFEHGRIIVVEKNANKAKDESEFFGLVLAAGPEATNAKPGEYVLCDGRLLFHYTPSNKRVFIGRDNVIVAKLK